VQNTQQTVTLTAANTLATGNYSFALNGTSGNLSGSTTVNVGVGALANFLIIQPLIPQVVTRFGSTTQTQLQTEAQGLGISNYLLNFSVTGLTPGVTASFSPNPVLVGSSTMLSVTAPANGQWIQNALFNVVATPAVSVPAENLTLDLVVAPEPGSIPNNRSDYLRTDDTPQSIVYDATNQRIFSSDSTLNRVDVVSTITRQLVKSIPVLSPRVLALTIDGNEVLVGSDSQQVQDISTISLQIVQQWMLPRISGGNYGIGYPFPLSDGTVAFQPSALGVLSGQLAIWNPANNTTSVISLPTSLENTACFVAAGGTNILVAECNTSSKAVVYNAATKTFSNVLQFPGFVLDVAASPDGSEFIILDDTYGINLYNSQLQQTAPIPAAGDISGFIFSPDGSHIYVTASDGVPVIFVSDGSTGALINTAPALGTIPPETGVYISPSPFVETPFAVDATGIIFGSADHGIAFDDSTYSVNYILGFNATPQFDQIVTPGFGPLNVATPVSFPEGEGFGSLPDVWFGGVRGAGAALGQAGVLTVTTPPSAQPGPVNVKVIEPDGTPIFNPLVFSYGPAPMFVDGDTATPAGGVTSDIIGLGLPTNPSQIQVTIGGQSASIVSASPVTIQGPYFPNLYPYPAVDVRITLPPGTGDQDLQITTSAGSATLSRAYHYAQNVSNFKSSDTFQAVLLDRKRNQLYLSAGNHIDVFSLATQQFLSPFTPAALSGQKTFYGMALTSDNSQLVAANLTDGSVVLINPDQPSSSTAVQINSPGTCGPQYVVTTNTGKAFVALSGGCTGVPLYELDLSSLQVTAINRQGLCCVEFLAASGSGSKLLIAEGGSPTQVVEIYDVESNTWVTNNAVMENFGANAAVSIDG